MTRTADTRPISARAPDCWRLHDAKARFSELVRRVHSDGPQHVTVHGREAVVVMTAAEFRRLTGERTGADLVAAMQALPEPDVEFVFPGVPMPVRAVVV